uniref:CCHC-type domain-containing protein n=1 Tax=Salmo trutta TaxID=8032 RepID=A0A674C7S4_SALTR
KLKADTHPNFSELLLCLRTEEDRRAVKINRMSSIVKPTLHMQSVSEVSRYCDPNAGQTASKSQTKAWFCFKCGENDHIASQCKNPPNKSLVDEKYKELKARQDEWKANNWALMHCNCHY